MYITLFRHRMCTWILLCLCLGIMFSGCATVRSFVRTDLVTTISHERLVQLRWHLQGIFSSRCWWPHWILEVNVKVTIGHRGCECIHIDAAVSVLGHQSPSSSLSSLPCWSYCTLVWVAPTRTLGIIGIRCQWFLHFRCDLPSIHHNGKSTEIHDSMGNIVCKSL